MNVLSVSRILHQRCEVQWCGKYHIPTVHVQNSWECLTLSLARYNLPCQIQFAKPRIENCSPVIPYDITLICPISSTLNLNLLIAHIGHALQLLNWYNNVIYKTIQIPNIDAHTHIYIIIYRLTKLNVKIM